jgi:hypothetical protein
MRLKSGGGCDAAAGAGAKVPARADAERAFLLLLDGLVRNPRPKINAILAFKFFPTKNVILTS